MRESTEAQLEAISTAIELSKLTVEGAQDVAHLISVLESGIFVQNGETFEVALSLQPSEKKGVTKEMAVRNAEIIALYTAKINLAVADIDELLLQTKADMLFKQPLKEDGIQKVTDPEQVFDALVQLRALLQTYLDLFHDLAEEEPEPLGHENATAIMQSLEEKLNEVILGQEAIVHHIVIALFCGGHVLLDGDPGLGKTELAKALGNNVGLLFKRLQCTSDLIPSDITGHDGEGKIFTNVLFADEINRLEPKTLSALLEAMQEGVVTNGESRILPNPFCMIATQNHEESVGTNAMPDAIYDRFLFRLNIELPEQAMVVNVIRNALRGKRKKNTEALADVYDVRAIQKTVETIPVPSGIYEYATALAFNTDNSDPVRTKAPLVRDYVEKSNVTRGGIALVRAARAQALLEGHSIVTADDIRAVTHAVLRSRITLKFNAVSKGITVDTIIDEILSITPEN